MRYDVIVLGAGLAGLSCARDLLAGGADVLVVEARDRVGGRVEQAELEDGRLVQLGGEVVGRAHTAYLGLVEELGLSVVPSYVAEPGEIVYSTAEGLGVGAPWWFTDADRIADERVTAAYVALAETVDPDYPWSHPDAPALDAVSVSRWLYEAGATPGVMRAWEIGALGLAGGSYDRTSLLGALRKSAAVPSGGHYDYDDWEGLRVAEGSATVAILMAAGLGPARVRTSSAVVAVEVSAGGCRVLLASGESLEAGAVVSALPVGPLRDVRISGVSEDRLASLARQRNALAAKLAVAYDWPFWQEEGLNGLSECEGVLGSTWPQGPGILSGLVPPERFGVLLGTPAERRTAEMLAEVARMYGDRARDPLACYVRMWGSDPWTQGYITQWAPGDVLGVGPLHGGHEPPFYVCGSDQWVAGYMEGAVRTGRAAAREALRHG